MYVLFVCSQSLKQDLARARERYMGALEYFSEDSALDATDLFGTLHDFFVAFSSAVAKVPYYTVS